MSANARQQTRLVSTSLNEYALLLETGALPDRCASRLPRVLDEITQNALSCPSCLDDGLAAESGPLLTLPEVFALLSTAAQERVLTLLAAA